MMSQLLSIVGTAFILTGVFMLSSGRWTSEQQRYFASQCAGCIFLFASSVLVGNYGWMVLNFVVGVLTARGFWRVR